MFNFLSPKLRISNCMISHTHNDKYCDTIVHYLDARPSPFVPAPMDFKLLGFKNCLRECIFAMMLI